MHQPTHEWLHNSITADVRHRYQIKFLRFEIDQNRVLSNLVNSMARIHKSEIYFFQM